MENPDAELTYVDGSSQHINRDVQHRILVNECLYVQGFSLTLLLTLPLGRRSHT